MMMRKSPEVIPLYLSGIAGQGVLSAAGAEDNSPGRKPGVTRSFLNSVARESGRQKFGSRILLGTDGSNRSSAATSGLASFRTILTPSLRPGLHSAARFRGLMERLHS